MGINLVFFSFSIILLLSSPVFALELDAPDEVVVNDSFSVEIIADVSVDESYDIKLFVNDDDGKIISRVRSDSDWKNPFYYLKGVFPDESNFKIKVLAVGDFDLCARLRLSGKSKYEEVCQSLEVEESSVNDPTVKSSPDPVPISSSSGKPSPTGASQVFISPPDPSLEPLSLPSSFVDEGPLRLLAPKSSVSPSSDFNSSSGSFHGWLVYVFLLFCVFLVVVLALRKL